MTERFIVIIAQQMHVKFEGLGEESLHSCNLLLLAKAWLTVTTDKAVKKWWKLAK